MKTLKSYEFKSSGSRNGRTYDWDKLMDGKIYQLEEGKDYECKQQTVLMMARTQAKKRGMRLRGTKVEGGVVLQAVPSENGDGGDEDAAE